MHTKTCKWRDGIGNIDLYLWFNDCTKAFIKVKNEEIIRIFENLNTGVEDMIIMIAC